MNSGVKKSNANIYIQNKYTKYIYTRRIYIRRIYIQKHLYKHIKRKVKFSIYFICSMSEILLYIKSKNSVYHQGKKVIFCFAILYIVDVVIVVS